MLALKRKAARLDKTIQPIGLGEFWVVEQINDTQYILRLKDDLVQTGSEFNTDLIIPIHHRVMELFVYHYDASEILSTNPFTFRWYTDDGPNWRLMFAETNVSYTSFGISYQDEVNGGRDLNPGSYRFATNTTATHLVNVSVRLEVLKR